MDKKAHIVIIQRQCPSCGLGFIQEIGKKIYQCDYSQCKATFDFSHYTDEELAVGKKTAEEKKTAL